MGLLWPKCRTWNLALLNLIQLALGHWSILSRSLCRAFFRSSRSTFPPNFPTWYHLQTSFPQVDQHSHPASQLGIICKLTDGELYPLIQIIDKDIKQDWTQNWALGITTCDLLQTGVNSIHHNSLARPPSQFYTQRRVRPSKPWAASFSRRMLWERVSKALLANTIIRFLLWIQDINLTPEWRHHFKKYSVSCACETDFLSMVSKQQLFSM